MYPINIPLKPIQSGNIACLVQPAMTKARPIAEPVKSDNSIQNILREIIDYISNALFGDASEQDKQGMQHWITTTCAENCANESRQSVRYVYEKPGVELRVEYRKDNITLCGRRSDAEKGMTWIIKRDANNRPLIYKNDFSWME